MLIVAHTCNLLCLIESQAPIRNAILSSDNFCSTRLCGYEPFVDDDEKYMYKKILKADYEFDSPYWDNITQNARVILLPYLSVY